MSATSPHGSVIASNRPSATRERKLTQGAVFGFGALSGDGRWISANPALARILGWGTVAELLTLAPGAWAVDPEDAKRVADAYARGALSRGLTFRARRGDGSEIMVRVSGQPAEAGFGDPSTIDVLVEDVTERRLLEDQLRQAQKMEAIGELTGGIAHDFNNILTIVLSNCDLIAEALSPDSRQIRADLEELQRAARRGADLIARLLSFSRRQELRLERVELGALVQEMEAMIRRLLPATISFNIQRAVACCHAIEADVTGIQQILLNLATNARDAMPTGGTLTVRLERVEGIAGRPTPCVRLIVEDTGCGMEPYVQERIFEPFFTTKRAGQGTGLGMPMVRGLVDQMGGGIAVDSQPGIGTVIRLEFPALEAHDGTARERSSEDDEAPSGGRILLAEGDEAIRRSVKRVLERRGFTVVSTADGREALDWFLEQGGGIDLVIADLIMPRMGGLELFRMVRNRGNSTRFLLTGGYLADDARREMERDPSLVFLPKPWTVPELAGRVQRMVYGDREAMAIR